MVDLYEIGTDDKGNKKQGTLIASFAWPTSMRMTCSTYVFSKLQPAKLTVQKNDKNKEEIFLSPSS